MALTDIPAPPAPTAADGALRIRRSVANLQNAGVQELAHILKEVTTYGIGPINAALGAADAAELQAVYAGISAMIPEIKRPAPLPTA